MNVVKIIFIIFTTNTIKLEDYLYLSVLSVNLSVLSSKVHDVTNKSTKLINYSDSFLQVQRSRGFYLSSCLKRLCEILYPRIFFTTSFISCSSDLG